MASLFPREEHAEALFHRILSNPGAEQQLYETFCMEQEKDVYKRQASSFRKKISNICRPAWQSEDAE